MPAVDEHSRGRTADFDRDGGGDRQRRGFRAGWRFCHLARSRAATIQHRRPLYPWPHFQAGQQYLRTLLIQAAKVLLMRPHNWARYSFGSWLNSASERLHRNKLAVALANKLARIAWNVLRHDKPFDAHLEVAAV